jgi:hypothetical protein
LYNWCSRQTIPVLRLVRVAGEIMLWLFDGIYRFTFESDSSFTQATNGVRMWEQKWTRKLEWLHSRTLYFARQLLQCIQFTSCQLLHAHPSHYWLCTFNAVNSVMSLTSSSVIFMKSHMFSECHGRHWAVFQPLPQEVDSLSYMYL